MKLLDPLNGMKFSQMHYFVHISFFLVMFFVDNKYEPSIYDIKPKHGDGTEGGHHEAHETHDTHAKGDDDWEAHDDDMPGHHLASRTPIQDLSKKRLLKKLKSRHVEEQRESRFKTNWDTFVSLSGHGPAHHAPVELSPEEEYAQEKFIFNMLQWTHLAIFLNYLLMAFLKK